MKLLFKRHTLRYIALGILGVLVLGGVTRTLLKDNTAGREQATVVRGDVEVLVSVSGTVRTKNTATLGFSGNGVVEEIYVKEGDRVEKGQVLASLVRSAQIAEYNNALAVLQSREAELAELIAGPRSEARDVTENEVSIAREELARTIKEQDQQVENAQRALYSQGLAAVPQNPDEAAAAPTITGTYTCEEPRTYTFDTYSSNADSGYSFRMTGGGDIQTSSAVTESAIPFGSCGLYIQFIAGESYNNASWSVEVPNTRSALYTTNKNNYELALKDRDNAIEAASQARDNAEKDAVLANAAPRSEELTRAEAQVAQARAQTASAEAKIADSTIRAPFSGIVTSIDAAAGEIARADLGITMTANDTYELKIRVPEIDITKIATGDRATASFDAQADERVPLTIAFISPLPTEIDGVSYYEALLAFDEVPSWMRTGLNADVDVVIDEAKDVLRLSKRFISVNETSQTFVHVLDGKESIQREIRTGLWGNDGFVEVEDITEGTTVIAP